MTNPELTHVGWLGPKDEMDRASHAFGKCSECREIITLKTPEASKSHSVQVARNH
jgi:hypothetical protein